MADMGNETDFNADAEDLLMLDSSTVFLEVSAGASESDVAHFYNGSVTLLGDEDNSIDLTGGVVDAADLATAGAEGTWGSWTLTTGSGADTIVSVGGSDTITPGLGADTVTGGGGADVINLSEAVSSADDVVIAALTDGSEVGADEGTFTGFDVITGFVSGVDEIDNNISLAHQEVVVAGTLPTGTASDLTSANYTDMDAVFAFLSDTAVEDLIETDGAYDASGNYTAGVTIAGVGTVIYAIENDATAALAIGEITLLATVDATLIASDFV
jgi:Ca2+-binding RTX toxin-like protein